MIIFFVVADVQSECALMVREMCAKYSAWNGLGALALRGIHFKLQRSKRALTRLDTAHKCAHKTANEHNSKHITQTQPSTCNLDVRSIHWFTSRQQTRENYFCQAK